MGDKGGGRGAGMEVIRDAWTDGPIRSWGRYQVYDCVAPQSSGIDSTRRQEVL